MKPIYFILAWISFALGVIGAFLPILPTTPFILLSAFLFSHSSPRFHRWLMNLPLAGSAVRDWQQHRVIRPRAKILCASMITFSIGMIVFNSRIQLAVKIIAIGILVTVGTYVLSRASHEEKKSS